VFLIFFYIFAACLTIKNQFFMKKVETIIRKSQFDDVKSALMNVKVTFFSYWDCTGHGNEKMGHVYRGVEHSTNEIQRKYLSIVVSDEFLDRTIEAILDSAHTGKIGDGKIFVSDIQEAYRIRTRQRGNQTLN
jgi:nitrogen regulatory protein P-II 1